MMIGVDYHPSFQQIAFLVEETGEYLFISRKMKTPRSRYVPVGPNFRGLSVFNVFIFQ